MKRSRILWLLVVYFVWAASKSAGSVVNYTQASDYALTSSIGIGWAFFVILVPIGLLELATAAALFLRRAVALTLGYIALLSEGIFTITSAALGLANFDVVQEIYRARQIARGAAVDSSEVTGMLTPGLLLGTTAAILGLYLVLYYQLRRVRPELKTV